MSSAELSALFEAASECAAADAARSDQAEAVAAAALTLSGAVLVGVWVEAMVDSACLCAETGPICEAHRLRDPIRASVCVRWTRARGAMVLPACGVCQERLAVFGADVLVAVRATDEGVVYEALRDLRPHPWWTAAQE